MATAARAVSASAVVRTGRAMAYQVGSTGCAIRTDTTGAAMHEVNEWYPAGTNGGGAIWRFNVSGGVATPPRGAH